MDEKYWSYKAASPTPTLEEAIRLGAISATTTEEEWQTLSPGFRRTIVQDKQRKRAIKD